MRELTAAEIESLASRPGVRRIAVENFLGTMDTGMGWRANGQNMLADARVYGWNEATVAALWEGIDLAAGYRRKQA